MENHSTFSDISSDFYFADHLILDESPTRVFYRNLLQGLVHKNNNTLGVIQGFATLMSMEEGLGKEMSENIEHMRKSVSDTSELAKIILTAGGCAQVNKEPASLLAMLPYLEESSKAICDEHNAGLQVNFSNSLPEVFADTSRFQELVRELIKNAAEATAESGQGDVVIDVLPPESVTLSDSNRVDLFIRNTCKDIAPDIMPKVFDPFFTTKSSSHYGIGLTTAGILAGQMDMRLGLRSKKGTTTAWLSLSTAA